jgi:Ring finger domain
METEEIRLESLEIPPSLRHHSELLTRNPQDLWNMIHTYQTNMTNYQKNIQMYLRMYHTMYHSYLHRQPRSEIGGGDMLNIPEIIHDVLETEMTGRYMDISHGIYTERVLRPDTRGFLPPEIPGWLSDHRRFIDQMDEMIYDINRNFRSYTTNMSNIFDMYRIPSLPGQEESNHARGETVLTYTIYPQTVPSTTSSHEIELLTETEIANTTDIRISTSHDESLQCPISLEQIHNGDSIIQIRHCGHIFKTSALYHWFRRSTLCPVCRYNLKTSSPSVTSTSTSTSSEHTTDETNTHNIQDIFNLMLHNRHITPSNRHAIRTLISLLGNHYTRT